MASDDPACSSHTKNYRKDCLQMLRAGLLVVNSTALLSLQKVLLDNTTARQVHASLQTVSPNHTRISPLYLTSKCELAMRAQRCWHAAHPLADNTEGGSHQSAKGEDSLTHRSESAA